MNNIRELEYWKKQYSKILAVDESGTSKFETDIANQNDNNKWIILSGVIFKIENFENNTKLFNSLKYKYWPDGLYKDCRVVFHGREIHKRMGCFSNKQIDYESFICDLKNMLQNAEYEILTIAINKHCLFNKYKKRAFNPYSLGYQFLMERFAFELGTKENAVVINESRGAKEDKKLYNLVTNFFETGGDYNIEKVNNIKEIYFNKKLNKSKKQSYYMLELADLVSYGAQLYLRDNNDDWMNFFDNKFVNGKKIDGENFKVFPNK